MKSLIKKLSPQFITNGYQYLKRLTNKIKNLYRSSEGIFTEIYTKNQWGGDKGQYYSGFGSTNEKIVSSFINMVTDKAYTENFINESFVDLGCGDFQVGGKLTNLCSNYVGADIVDSLIKYNQNRYGNSKTSFLQLDIIEDDLPIGDVCFVRQVFQHLSNKQIMNVLPKLKAYKWVFITEHLPTPNKNIKPNIDKICGPDIRLKKNSGIFLTEPPFIIPKNKIETVLEVPIKSNNSKIDQGSIVTFLYKP